MGDLHLANKAWKCAVNLLAPSRCLCFCCRGALALLRRLLAFDPTDRPTAEEALADPYFHNLHSPAREPSAQSISKLAFDFERRKLAIEEVRELIYREILEYHPQVCIRSNVWSAPCLVGLDMKGEIEQQLVAAASNSTLSSCSLCGQGKQQLNLASCYDLSCAQAYALLFLLLLCVGVAGLLVRRPLAHISVPQCSGQLQAPVHAP